MATGENMVGDQPILFLRALFERRGGLAYGEAVTQLEHALQCAALAEGDGATPELITAALLHDLGHLLHRDAGGALMTGLDDHHEALGASCLQPWFPAEVTRPIALHVEAKRYLCHVDPSYADSLSSVSLQTLRLQGGAMGRAEAEAFGARAHAVAAVRLRRWDERGKQAGRRTPPLTHFLGIAARCRLPRSR